MLLLRPAYSRFFTRGEARRYNSFCETLHFDPGGLSGGVRVGTEWHGFKQNLEHFVASRKRCSLKKCDVFYGTPSF